MVYCVEFNLLSIFSSNFYVINLFNDLYNFLLNICNLLHNFFNFNCFIQILKRIFLNCLLM